MTATDHQPDTTIRLYAAALPPVGNPGHLPVTRCPVCSALVETDHADTHRLWHAEVSRG